MHSKTLATYFLFVAPIYGTAKPAPYMIGSMSMNPAFGLAKRQAGYQPNQTYCGPGADCAASCGQGYIQCASNDNSLHCFDPVINETCCPDGTGSKYPTSLTQAEANLQSRFLQRRILLHQGYNRKHMVLPERIEPFCLRCCILLDRYSRLRSVDSSTYNLYRHNFSLRFRVGECHYHRKCNCPNRHYHWPILQHQHDFLFALWTVHWRCECPGSSWWISCFGDCCWGSFLVALSLE
jgi:hypothetical protein